MSLEYREDFDVATADEVHETVAAQENLAYIFAPQLRHDAPYTRHLCSEPGFFEELLDPPRCSDGIVVGDAVADVLEILLRSRRPPEPRRRDFGCRTRLLASRRAHGAGFAPKRSFMRVATSS